MLAPAGRVALGRLTDLRGRSISLPASVLADPTGRRARRLRTAGRVVASVLLVWLCGLVLGGLGLFPLSELPLGGGLRVGQQPARLSSMPTPRARESTDTRSVGSRPSDARSASPSQTAAHAFSAPARQVPATSAGARAHNHARHQPASRSTTAAGGASGPTTAGAVSTAPTSATAAPGHSGSAPGRTRGHSSTAPGSSGSGHGHGPKRTTAHGAAAG